MNNVASPLFDLSGRVALIVGASRGISRGIAQGFAEAGASVEAGAQQIVFNPILDETEHLEICAKDSCST